jgi:uncharacterized membrane protein
MTPKILTRATQALGWFSLVVGLTEIISPGAMGKLMGARPRAGLTRLFGLREVAAGLGLLSGRRTSLWLWSRVGGDVLDLASLGRLLSAKHADKENVSIVLGSVAAVTAIDLYCAIKASEKEAVPFAVVEKISVGRPSAELFAWWRAPDRLARIMAHVAEVSDPGDGTTHWKTHSGSFEWVSEFTEERPGELLRWRSIRGDLSSEGSVRFCPAPADHGTEVVLEWRIKPPLGDLGGAALQAFKIVPRKLSLHALRRFKSLAETGEAPSLRENPTARPGGAAT